MHKSQKSQSTFQSEFKNEPSIVADPAITDRLNPIEQVAHSVVQESCD